MLPNNQAVGPRRHAPCLRKRRALSSRALPRALGRPELTGPTRVLAFLHESYDLQERRASVLLLFKGRIEASRPCSG